MKIFKKAALFVSACAAAVAISGCATAFPQGVIYTGVSLPGTVGNGELKYSKTGKASCTSVLSCFAVGNASINAACANSNITRVSWVTYKATSVLGLYGSYEVTVYGD